MDVRPFRGYRYGIGRVRDVSKVVAPPYDQISPETQERLCAMSPENIVRVTLPKEVPGHNKYDGAREVLDTWLAAGVWTREELPAIYPYHQTYRLGEATITRKGLIALGEVTDYAAGIVHPHERTHAKPKEDRLRLLEATGGDFGLVFMLLNDPGGELLEAASPPAGSPPLVEARDLRGELHRLWRITDPRAVARVQALMADKPVIIADGHHRYETALAYRREHPGADFKLMAFFSLDAPGCTIFPNHRLVHDLPAFDPEDLLAQAGQWFDVERLPAVEDHAAEGERLVERLAAVHKAGRVGVGVVAGKASGSALLTLRPEAESRIAWPPGKPEAWRRLGVSVLHEGLLRPLLGITDAELTAKTRVDYTASATEAVRLTRAGSCQAAFLLHPTMPGELREIVASGEVLPQKSTHFYPKLLTGLAFARVGE